MAVVATHLETEYWDHSFRNIKNDFMYSPFCNGPRVGLIFTEHCFRMLIGNLLPSFVILLKQSLFDLIKFETQLVFELMSHARIP